MSGFFTSLFPPKGAFDVASAAGNISWVALLSFRLSRPALAKTGLLIRKDFNTEKLTDWGGLAGRTICSNRRP